MWLDNLKALKISKGWSNKQIADASKLPERTVSRIFSGETDHPRVDTISIIAITLGGSISEVFADTNVVVATQTLAEVKETADVIEAERDLVIVENEMLKSKNLALEKELELLKKELQHKDELLALHNFYSKLIPHN